MPVAYRKWFLKRLLKEFEQKKNASAKDGRGDINQDNMQKLKKYEEVLSNKT